MKRDHITYGREVIKMEAEAVAAMADRLDDNFSKAVQKLHDCKGRVIVTGIGKSGLIGRKITATFNSTGVASFFLHPAEAMHGDLGLIRGEDVLLVISKSGQLDELETIIVAARRLGVCIIMLGGTIGSPLYQKADIALDCSVQTEACPNNLVPTSSSTAALVMGDAIALALLRARDFGPDDFAALHPGGFLGRRLLKHVFEVHHTGDSIPMVAPDATMPQLMLEMTSKRLGCVTMTTPDGKLAGIFTDGDLRRLVERERDFSMLTASQVMIANPKRINQGAVLDAALALMEKYSITQLPTVDDSGRLTGILHLHDILRSKLV